MILDSLIYLWGYCIWMLLVYLLRTDPCRLSRQRLAVFCTISGALQVFLYIPFWRLAGSSPTAISTFGAITWVLFALPAWWIYPKRGWKNLFLWCISGVVIAICIGPGNLAAALLPQDGPLSPRLAYLLVTAIVSAPVMAGVIHLQRRFAGLYSAGGSKTWRQMAAIAAILFVMQLAVGNIYALQNTTPVRFLLARLATAFAMFAVLYIAGLSQRQAGEAARLTARAAAAQETATQKEETYARIVEGVEEASRLRHDLRQVFTAMQGMNSPGQEHDLALYCREVLAQLRNVEQEVGRHETP